MARALRFVVPLALLVAIGVASGFLVGESRADLEAQVFTSRPYRLRLVVPRGWRATDQPSYPGLLLWMLRAQPEGQIVLTSEAFTRQRFCSWPVACRSSNESLSAKYACALRQKLAAQKIQVGPVQAGPKDNDAAGLPSVWFEYDDGKRFLRQAVAVADDRAVTLVLSSPSNDARATNVRPFEQALRSLHTLTADETAAAAGNDAGLPPADAGELVETAAIDAGATFESAPAPTKIEPVGPCPGR